MLTSNGQVVRRSTNQIASADAASLAQGTSQGYWAQFFNALMRALSGMAV